MGKNMRAKYLPKLFLILIECCCFFSCAQSGRWKLVWQDEFNYQGEPDTGKWSVVVKPPRWVNQEAQAYMERRENLRVENGHLIIQARGSHDKGYTSARLDTFLSGKWTYGRLEVRAKLPEGRGTWPAIFMLPTENIKSVYGWPSSGEIDIMEHVGHNPGTVQASVHCSEYNHLQGNQKFGTFYMEDPFNEFHVYTVEWYPDRLDFFVDENKYFTFRKEMNGWETWPFYKDFYLILCLAIGGSWGGAQGIDDSIFPTQMVIDYVRVYQADPEKLIDNPSEYGTED
jgi:beta-glucanase (GH16 family)